MRLWIPDGHDQLDCSTNEARNVNRVPHLRLEPICVNGPKNMNIWERSNYCGTLTLATNLARANKSKQRKNQWSIVVIIPNFQTHKSWNSNGTKFWCSNFWYFIDGANKTKSCWRRNWRITHRHIAHQEKNTKTTNKQIANRNQKEDVVSSWLALLRSYFDQFHIRFSRWHTHTLMQCASNVSRLFSRSTCTNRHTTSFCRYCIDTQFFPLSLFFNLVIM